jgi:hypothetical protein
MDEKEQLPEIVSWKNDIKQYTQTKRTRPLEFYRNPDHVRTKGITRMPQEEFDPVLSRYICNSKDKEFGQRTTHPRMQKKPRNVSLDNSTKFNIITLEGRDGEILPKHENYLTLCSRFNIITNQTFEIDKPIKLFIGKKQVKLPFESADYNILNNFPLKSEEVIQKSVNHSKRRRQSNFVNQEQIDPILMAYKNNDREIAEQKMAIESIARQQKRKYDQLPNTEKINDLNSAILPLLTYKTSRSIHQKYLPLSSTHFRTSVKENFEKMIKQRAALRSDLDEQRRLARYKENINKTVRQENLNLSCVQKEIETNQLDKPVESCKFRYRNGDR